MSDEEGVLARVVHEITDYVGAGLSVHLVGPRGSGRSELCALVADRLEDDGLPVLHVGGHRAWQIEPFAALTAAGIGGATPAGARRTIGEMTAALNKQVENGTVLVIDDADVLDTYSVGALRNIHRQRRLLAVTSSRHQHPVAENTLMLGIAPSVQVRTPTLEVDEVHEECRSILGGPVEAGSLARITMVTGGLLGLVRAIATIGPRAGVLEQLDGLWRLPRRTGWAPELASAVEPLVAGLDQEAWDAATALAVTGPVPLDEAEKIIERRVLDALFAHGLARHSEDGPGSGVVGLYPPIIGDYLIAEGSAFGLVIARNHLATEQRLLDYATHRPRGADAALLHQRSLRQMADTVTRARSRWTEMPSAETALPLLMALRNTAAPRDQIEELERRTPLADRQESAWLLAWFASWKAIELGDLDAAKEVLDRGLERLPGFAATLEGARAHLQFQTEYVPELPTVEPSPRDEVGTEVLGVVAAERLLAAGAVEQARNLLEGQQPQKPYPAGVHAFLTGLADVLGGDVDRGIDSARDHLEAANQGDSAELILIHSYLSVLGLSIAGRLTEASQVAFRTLSSSSVAAHRDLAHTGILTLGAEIAMAQGRPEYARSLASQIGGAKVPLGPWPGMVAGIMAPSSGQMPSLKELCELVGQRLDAGYITGGVFLAVEAVERGANENKHIARAAALAAETESPLLQGMGAYAATTASGDTDGLREAIVTLADAGALVFVTRAAISLAILQREAGDLAAAAETLDMAWERSEISGSRAGMFGRAVTHIGLSGRESEVLRLLPDGPTTASLAADLEMSTRTVETHLHNISRKTGVSGREDLTRVASTWLRPIPNGDYSAGVRHFTSGS
ncbi:LuxR family transcriptional regulator [Nocardioides panzhihuensis]|uniref:DNA-binding NarL/FixJ family response regulator n=1 Tax=Nocardioides panzhihuensis TaxID=860243 RepID=A0A7Z0DHL7_9ACTN|nr:LuxR family transcriptional regulator [Nocardioides panzhihuensis]NYI75761.1 DNA-binding NarL/FixJ family response regulator [Nocardioides panzhihuensis]